MDHKKLIFPVILLAGVTACSDDGDDTDTAAKPEPTSYSVRAIDGYLQNAKVWLDVNGDFNVDGDPMVTTGDNGIAKFEGIDTPELYPVIVQVEAGITIDEDDIANVQGGKVTHSYAMSAPAGEKNITPLSTQVHLMTVQEGISPDEATGRVADSLGLIADGLLDDFIDAATANSANAYAASNIVDSKSLPVSAADLQVVATDPESELAKKYAKMTEAVNQTIKATVEDIGVNEDFTEVDDIYAPSADPSLDSDRDGVPNHIDALPYDGDYYLPADKLAYTTWHMGHQVISSINNQGVVITNEAKQFEGTAKGSMWFYTPLKAEFQLSALGDFRFKVNSVKDPVGGIFTNIYVTLSVEDIPGNEEIYEEMRSRVDCVSAEAGDTNAAPLKKTSPGNYVFNIVNDYTLNNTIADINSDPVNSTCGPISKTDFMVTRYYDVEGLVNNSPVVTHGNFILKYGDTNYHGTDSFTIDAYDMAKTYQIGNGPELVVANAINLDEHDGSELTGGSYGESVWMYPSNIGGESIAPFAVIAPLSNYQDFRFKTSDADGYVNIYVVAKDTAPEDLWKPSYGEEESDFLAIEWGDWINKFQTKQIYRITIHSKAIDDDYGNSLLGIKDTLMKDHNVDINDLELINYIDAPDKDVGMAGNFILKMDVDVNTTFTVKEFTF